MENNKNPKIFLTESYKVEHKKINDKLVFNSCYNTIPSSNLVIFDDDIAKRIMEGAVNITNALMKRECLLVKK